MAEVMNDPPCNAPDGDVGPFDAEGWKLHADGDRVHRCSCAIHGGDGCDGQCGPNNR